MGWAASVCQRHSKCVTENNHALRKSTSRKICINLHNSHVPMKGNQGLEALAALCGGETKARTDDQATNTTSTQSNNSAKAAPAPAPMPTSTTIRPSASLPSPTAPLLPAPLDAMQQPPPAVGVDPSFQHWQSMAAAYGGIPNAATTAAAAAILQAAAVQTGGAPQPHPSPADPNAFGAMQQLAYYQCLHAQAAAAQAQVQAQAQAAHMLGPDGKPASVPGVPVAAPYKIDATTPATLPLPGQQMQIPSQIGECVISTFKFGLVTSARREYLACCCCDFLCPVRSR